MTKVELSASNTAGDAAGTIHRHSSAQTLLFVKNITKRFGMLLANDSVNLTITPGEIHAFLGENGAGKSTFVKILYGSLRPDAGSLIWKGEPVTIASPAHARDLGIGMVFQHFSLFEALSVEENISLALSKKHRTRKIAAQIEELSKNYGLPLDPSAIVADLSVGERQRVEIIRCLLQNPELIIMDEPTSVLTPQEAEGLFEVLQKLASEGKSILYISHRLEEVRQLCDTATILRHGKCVGECNPKQETAKSMAAMMVGSHVSDVKRLAKTEDISKPRLQLSKVSVASANGLGTDLQDIFLNVMSGEIFCIAGIAGNGQSELFDVVSGEQTISDKTLISIDGEHCGHLAVSARRRMGAAFVPEERNGHAALGNIRLSRNLLITRNDTEDGTVLHGLINTKALARIERDIAKTFDVRMARPDVEAGALSGGNLQKFVVGREISRNPNVLVINQPTWGVDAGAALLIRQKLIDLSRSGAAILVISQDLDEIFEIADRVAVLADGRLSEGYTIDAITREDIGLLMSGIDPKERPMPVQEVALAV